jgi:hypothetical protein
LGEEKRMRKFYILRRLAGLRTVVEQVEDNLLIYQI